MINEKFGYINNKGVIVIAPAYDDADVFILGLCAAKKDGKWGIINTKGEWIIKPIYNNLIITETGLIKSQLKEDDNPVNINLRGETVYEKYSG